jgi:hypothetical protein
MTLVYRRLLGLICLIAATAAAIWLLQRDQTQLANKNQERAEHSKLFASLQGVQVKRLTLHAPHDSFVLLREGSATAPWMLESPLRTLADDSVVQGLVHSLQEVVVKQEVDPKAPPAPADDPNAPPTAGGADLSLFGLSPPQYHITASGPAADGNDRMAVVMLGKKSSFDNRVYAKRAGEGPVLLVDGDISRAVNLDLFALRDKRPLPFEAGEVRRLEVHQARDGKQPARHFAMEKEGAHFFLEALDLSKKASAPSWRVDDTQAETLLNALCGLRGKRVVAEASRRPMAASTAAAAAELAPFGLQAPRFVLHVHAAAPDGKVQEANLLLGQVHLGDSTHYFGKREGNFPIFELGSDWALKKLSIPLDGLRDLHVLQFDPDAVHQISLQAGESNLLLQKTPHPDNAAGAHLWHPIDASGDKGAELQDVRVIGLLYKLKALRAERIVDPSPTPAALRAAGLQPPARRVRFLDAAGACLGALDIGRISPKAPNTVQVRTAGAEAAWMGEVSTLSLADVVAEAAHFMEPTPQPPTEPKATP